MYIFSFDFINLIIPGFFAISSKASYSLRIIYLTFLFISADTHNIFNHLCRSSVTSRVEPSSSLGCYNLKCGISGQAENKGLRQKFKISKSTEIFREATLFLQDERYIRTCDLQNAGKIFGANLYYHICLPSYLNKYHRAKRKNETSNIIKSTKRDTFISYIDFLQTIFDAATAF